MGIDRLAQFDSYQRIATRQISGQGTEVHHFILNLQQAYSLFINSFDQKERKDLWRIMHLLGIDLATITEKPCPEPEAQIYTQLEKE